MLPKLITTENPLARQVIQTEWILLGFALCLETLTLVFVPGETEHLGLGILCLTLLAGLSIYWPVRKPHYHRLVLIIFEIFLVTLASALGLSRWIWPLYLAVVARAAVLLEGRHFWLIVFTAFISQESWYLFKWIGAQPLSDWTIMLMASVMVAFVLTGTYGFLMVVFGWLMLTLQKEQKLLAETQRLSRENAQLAILLERSRIAREIHDTLGHSLTSLKIQLELSKRLMEVDGARAKEALLQAEQMAARSLTDTRVALQNVRNADFDFANAVRQLVAEAEADGKIKIQMDIHSIELPNALAYQLYRVVQESITNALKHARASQLKIDLSRQNENLELNVCDNGKGFDEQTSTDGLGIMGMKERIISLNGRVELFSEPDKGTRVQVIVPL